VARVLRMPATQADHEELFMERYGRLLGWALHLSNSDRARAEDLVHDAYIQFTLVRPELHLIHNLDAYLFGMLRKLHLSHLRRITRRAHRELSIADYDAAIIALRVTDQSEQLHLREELHRICRYACARKETSKAGSVLLLRFFHGYYPNEIAQIIRSSRPAVEERLRLARSEVKAYLKDPDRFKVMGAEFSEDAQHPDQTTSTEGILRELHRQITRSRRTECLAGEGWKNFYRSPDSPAIDCATLAHLVSCHECLDRVNGLLGLPPLAERHPVDTLGTDVRAKRKNGGGGGDEGGGGDDGSDDGEGPHSGGAGGGGSVPGDELKQCRQRAREVFEHHPRELCVAVNGEISGTQSIGAQHNEQTLHISDRIEFVEVFSEQDIRLLLLSVDELPSVGSFQREAQVCLSGDREVRVVLDLSSATSVLQVTYEDPSWTPPPEELIVGAEASRGMSVVGSNRVVQPKSENAGSSGSIEDIAGRVAKLWRDFVQHLGAGRLWMQPGTITALVAALIIAVLVVLHFHTEPVSAAALLGRSRLADEAIAKNPTAVSHRVVNLEERKRGSTSAVKRRVEAWRSASTGIAVRRVYDESNQMVIGEVARADGTQVLLSPGIVSTAPRTAAHGAKDAVQAGALWRLDPSAEDFVSLIGETAVAQVEERADTYVIHYDGHQNKVTPALLEASLTLKKTDLHGVELKVALERDGEVWEYDWAESSLTFDPNGSIDPSLLDARSATAPSGDKPTESSAKPPEELKTRALLNATASAELEVEVNYLLDQVKANLTEQVNLTRTANDQLELSALVDTENRKNQILNALRPVAGNPAVHIKVRTVAEVARENAQSSRGPASVREVEVEQNEFRGSELRRYFLIRSNGDGPRADLEMRQFCTRMMAFSRQAVQHAAALKRLTTNFSLERTRSLDESARAKFIAMISQHVLEYHRNVTDLREGLHTLFRAPQITATGTAGAITNDREMAAAVNRLLQFSYASDEAVRAALALSDQGQSLDAIRSAQFWTALNSSEKLAPAIHDAYQR
jgi:RNA polymerase sigma factor (sigma-70 family)